MNDVVFVKQGNRDAYATPADIKQAADCLKKAMQAISFAYGQLNAAKPAPDVGTDMMLIPEIMTGVSCVEYEWADALKSLNIPSVIGREVEERHAALRKANETIRDLKEQMGADIGPNHIQAGIKNATKIVHAWWKSCGFAYVSSVTMKEYNCEITASLLQAETRSLEREGDSIESMAEIWAKQMLDRGWQTVSEDGGQDRYIIDNDVNATLLKDAITARFSGARISERKATSVYGKDVMMIREVRFSVSLESIFDGVKLGDIEN